jgi:hypothetical protein
MQFDYTIIYITANLIPKKFAEFQRSILLDAIKGAPIISISREPLDFGLNIIDDGKKCTDNIYRQILRAAKLATTKYVIIAEDDTLYNETHFTFYRPEDDTFAYNKNRLTLFTWGDPQYHWRNRLSNCSLIAPRELLIEALEERYTKWPNGIPERIVGELGRGMVERNLHVKERKCTEQFSKVSIIQFNHEFASEERQRIHRKTYGPIRAYDIFYWGKASELVSKFQ